MQKVESSANWWLVEGEESGCLSSVGVDVGGWTGKSLEMTVTEMRIMDDLQVGAVRRLTRKEPDREWIIPQEVLDRGMRNPGQVLQGRKRM